MSAQMPVRHLDTLRPITALAANRPHGDRLRYLAGCRCEWCKKANSLYENARRQARARGEHNGIVDATEAREHLLYLRKRHVGRRAVHAVSGVSETVLQDITRGRKPKIRAETARRILRITVKQCSDHALVSAKTTWKLLDQLLEEGYTEAQLAKALGCQQPYLQIKRTKVLAITELKVQRLHARLMA